MEHLNYQYPVRFLFNLILINSTLLIYNLAQTTREEKQSVTNKQDDDDTDDENYGQSKSILL